MIIVGIEWLTRFETEHFERMKNLFFMKTAIISEDDEAVFS